MDMWEPYVQATLAGLPLAAEKIGPYLTLAASLAVTRQSGTPLDAELAALIADLAGDARSLRHGRRLGCGHLRQPVQIKRGRRRGRQRPAHRHADGGKQEPERDTTSQHRRLERRPPQPDHPPRGPGW